MQCVCVRQIKNYLKKNSKNAMSHNMVYQNHRMWTALKDGYLTIMRLKHFHSVFLCVLPANKQVQHPTAATEKTMQYITYLMDRS
jgi:hypothetical protein